MKAGITTIEDVHTHYGPIVGDSVTALISRVPDADLEDLGFVVDVVVTAIESTMVALGFGFERKEGF